MQNIHEPSKPIQLMYFWIGLAATFAYRVIIVLNFFDPVWVKVAWYIGTIGFIIYFWSRYRAVQQFQSLIDDNELVAAAQKSDDFSPEQTQALTHVLSSLKETKAQINYVMIFILSFIALIAGLYLDFVM